MNAESAELAIELMDERMVLTPERALLWQRKATLFVADAHFGKAASFRIGGIAVPQQTTNDTLSRLDGLIRRHAVERIVFLGDLTHSKHSHAEATRRTLADWRARNRHLQLDLVRGNHERRGASPYGLDVQVHDEMLEVGPFIARHEPEAVAGAYVLAGHVHPAMRLSAGGDCLRLPCFAFSPTVGILPAFGASTGMSTITPAADTHYYLVTDKVVVAV